MNDQEVLTKCIEIAKGRGWDMFGWPKYEVVAGGIGLYEGSGDSFLSRKNGELFDDATIIFNHQFATALFGRRLYVGRVIPSLSAVKSYQVDYVVSEYELIKNDEWEYRLQELALATDRIDYLRKYLEEVR